MIARECPFCGRHEPELAQEMPFSGVPLWYYRCVRCAARGPQTYSSAVHALFLWDGGSKS